MIPDSCVEHHITLAQSSSPTPQQETMPFLEGQSLGKSWTRFKGSHVDGTASQALAESLPVIVNLSHQRLLVPANHLRPLQQPG